MVFDDAADDGQTQTSSAFLGGKIGKEEPLFQLLGNAVAGVGNGDFDGIPAGTSEVEI